MLSVHVCRYQPDGLPFFLKFGHPDTVVGKTLATVVFKDPKPDPQTIDKERVKGVRTIYIYTCSFIHTFTISKANNILVDFCIFLCGIYILIYSKRIHSTLTDSHTHLSLMFSSHPLSTAYQYQPRRRHLATSNRWKERTTIVDAKRA